MTEPAARPDADTVAVSGRRIDGSTRMECKICWQVYDPHVGDPLGEVPAGTSFTEIPPHWRCPQCDGAREEFLVIADGGSGGIRERR